MISLKLDKYIKIDDSVTKSQNLCDRFDKADLDKIGNLVSDGFERDETSRTKWKRRNEAGMDMAMQIQKDKNFPWQGCANVIFPLISIAAMQFGARAYSNLIQGTDVVRYRTIGNDPEGALAARSDRISKHMSWQVLEEDSSWEEQHDRLFINVGIVGCNFVKTYYSGMRGHNTSELVLARDLVMDYWAKSVESCQRKTHIVPMYRNEIYERVKAGTFFDVLSESWYSSQPQTYEGPIHHDNRQGIDPPPADDDTPFQTLEQHRYLDLDNDGYSEPYIVTVEKSSKCTLRIVARWDSEADIDRDGAGDIIRIRAAEYFTKYTFIPAPDGGIYDMGFGVLLGPLNESVNAGINQMLDAGTMSLTAGGFLGRGAKIRGGTYTFAPFQWVHVDSSGDDLRKNMVQTPTKEPSSVMFQLIGLLINYTDRIAGTVEQMVGENPGQNTPAETSRNTMEQGMQMFSSIFKRQWRAMKEEFKKLHRLNAIYLPSKMKFGAEGNYIMREDYLTDANMVVPVANPNITSAGMKFAKARELATRAWQVPGYDTTLTERHLINAMELEGAETYYPGPDKVPPLPNPKMAAAQLKLQEREMTLKSNEKMRLVELMSEKHEVAARIDLIEAQTAKILHDMKGDDARLLLERFSIAIDALKAHHEAVDRRIQSMQGDSDGGGKSVGASMEGMEGPGGNQGVLPAPAPNQGGT